MNPRGSISRAARLARATRLAALLAALLPLGIAGAARAQEYPQGPVRMIIGFAPNGLADIVGRILARSMSTVGGQPVTVENIPGKGGTVAAAQFLRARPDGSTLMFGNSDTLSFDLHATPQETQNFDTLVPVAPAAIEPVALLVPLRGPATVQELLAQARARPGQLAYSSTGRGTTENAAGTQFQLITNVKLREVPYSNRRAGLDDLARGVNQLAFGTPLIVSDLIQRGSVRGLASSSTSRVRVLPGVPTAAEAGIPNFRYVSWSGVFAPPGTPAPLVARINALVRRAYNNPEFVGGQARLGTDEAAFTAAQSPAAFAAFVREDSKRSAAIVQAQGGPEQPQAGAAPVGGNPTTGIGSARRPPAGQGTAR